MIGGSKINIRIHSGIALFPLLRPGPTG